MRGARQIGARQLSVVVKIHEPCKVTQDAPSSARASRPSRIDFLNWKPNGRAFIFASASKHPETGAVTEADRAIPARHHSIQRDLSQ